MEERVSYRREGAVALITMDDGKVNAMSPAMIAAVGRALDRAASEAVPIVLTGRPGMFCAGFDLAVLRSGSVDTLRMLRAGFELSARLLAFPYPVVIACSGHAIAMGVFLVLSGDDRLGVAGDFSLQANEVAIGLTMPRAAIAICRERLDPAHFTRATLLAERYGPEEAVQAGFLDRLVDAESLVSKAIERAQQLAALDVQAHTRSKLRVRARTLRSLRRGLKLDLCELSLLGARRLLASKLRRRRGQARG